MTESTQLKIYNTLSRQKEVFTPINPPQVKMYVCGPTVYNFLHVGNFRGPVVFNLVRQWLEYLGFNVFYALNFTDVDDRIIDKAKDEGQTSLQISERYIAEYKKDFQSLGLRPHEINPKVTDSMPAIIDLVQGLIEKKIAYIQDGDVLFAIDQFPEYGKLSGRKTEELLSGVRIESHEKKKNPLDFALWKRAKPGEPSWPSPWGDGRPGWHIECSAMICEHLGEQIDIHGGGLDLIFPHHENEIAQTEGFTQHKFVNTWMHVNMLNLSGQKMSKSVGNIVSLRDFLHEYHAEIYKWMILSVHYRSVLDFGEETVQRAILGLAKVYSGLALADSYLSSVTSPSSAESSSASVATRNVDINSVRTGAESAAASKAASKAGLTSNLSHDQKANLAGDSGFNQICESAWNKIVDSLNDDFNTPEAFAAMYEVLRAFNSQVKRGMAAQESILNKCFSFKIFILKFGQVLSLFLENPQTFLTTLDDKLLQKMNIKRIDVDRLVQVRAQARAEKNFAVSDQIRKQLSEMRIQVSDTAQGSFWEVDKHS